MSTLQKLWEARTPCGVSRARHAVCCRLLQASVREAERVAGAPLPAISHFSEEQSSELRDRIFDEFNTLAVILRAPSATFIKAAAASIDEDEPDAPLVRAHESGMYHKPVHRRTVQRRAESAILLLPTLAAGVAREGIQTGHTLLRPQSHPHCI